MNPSSPVSPTPSISKFGRKARHPASPPVRYTGAMVRLPASGTITLWRLHIHLVLPLAILSAPSKLTGRQSKLSPCPLARYQRYQSRARSRPTELGPFCSQASGVPQLRTPPSYLSPRLSWAFLVPGRTGARRTLMFRYHLDVQFPDFRLKRFRRAGLREVHRRVVTVWRATLTRLPSLTPGATRRLAPGL